MGEAKRVQKRLQALQRHADSGKLIDCRELHGLKKTKEIVTWIRQTSKGTVPP